MSNPIKELDRECADCGHPSVDHIYSPPMHSSSDGLPTFDGCWADGSGDPTDEDAAPNCGCFGFDPGDEDEGAIDYHPFRCGANCEVCADR